MADDFGFARWPALDSVFDRALDLEGVERERFLDQSCSDPEMRAEVESLLAAAARSPDFLAAGPTGLGPDLFGEFRPATLVGRIMGAYRLLEVIGRGGTSTVYRGERCDGAFQQQVAVKVLEPSLLGRTSRARFRQERQILAGLEHPNIARLLDGGLTEDGLPFIVMEFVRGDPIDEYCDARRLSVRERLQLFMPVCRAVQHAHGNLVVHRDLKPGNVLVTDEGTVKLLDFGIAKLLGAVESGGEVVQTQVGIVPMTPAFAAPEQIAGGTATTATDIYQLGAILHLLLTGHRVFEDGWRAMLARLEEDRTRAPSTWVTRPEAPRERDDSEGAPRRSAAELAGLRRTTVRRLKRELGGELDTLVLTATKSDPARRYHSAEALAQDIERYLAGGPLQAHPDSIGYRVGKFLRRHPISAAATATLTVVAVGLGIRWAQEYRRAEVEAAKATAVTDFMLGLFEQPDLEDATTDTLTVRALLEVGAERVEYQLEDQPAVQAAVKSAVGRAFLGLGRVDQAEALFQSALELRREHLAPGHPDAASSLADMGEVKFEASALGEAETYYREALSATRSAHGWRSREAARSLGGLALVLHQQGNTEEAERTYVEAIDTYRRIGPLDARATDLLMNLGWLHERQQRHREAEALFREALVMRRAILGEGHASVGSALAALSQIEARTGRTDSAVVHATEALDIFEGVFGPDGARLVGPLIARGNAGLRAGRLGQAEADYRRALTLVTREWGEASPNTARIHNDLGNLLRDRGNFKESQEHLQAAVAGYSASLGADHLFTGIALHNLANTLGARDRLEAAQETVQEAMRIFDAEGFSSSPTMGRSLTLLGGFLVLRGRPEDADSILSRALAIWEAAEPTDAVQLAQTRAQLARSFHLQGEMDQAEALLLSAHLALRDTRGESHPETRRVAGWLAELYADVGRPEDAEHYRLLASASG